jgi:hypothetical protein
MPSREREWGERHCVRDRFFFGQKKDLCLSVSHSLRNQTKKLESNVQLKEKDSFTSRLIFSYRLKKVKKLLILYLISGNKAGKDYVEVTDSFNLKPNKNNFLMSIAR